MWRYVLLALLSISLPQSATLADEPKPKDDVYHSPDFFNANGRFAEFLPHARKFLKDHPEDHRGPQIAMDMLMAAAAAADADASRDAQRLLLFKFSRSLQTDYLIRTTDINHLNQVFKSTFQDKEKPLSEKTLQSFYIALDIAFRLHGPSMADDELLAQAALASPGVAGAVACQASIKDKESDAAKLLEIALDEDLKANEKFVRLQSLKDSKSARAWQTFLYTEVLSQRDRETSAVQKVYVRNLLSENEFAKAFESLKTVPSVDADPQMLFWRGWAEAAAGKTSEAIQTLEEVSAKHPKSPWSSSAKTLATTVSNLSDNLSEHLSGLEEVYSNLRGQPPEVMQLDLVYKAGADEAETIQAHLGLDFTKDDIDVLVKKAGKPLLGYTTSKLGLSFFCQGEDRIHKFSSKGQSQWLYLGIAPTLKGDYHYGFNFNSSPAPGGLRNGIQTLIQSPALITKSAREKFVRHQLKKGILPAKVEQVGNEDERSYRWLMPQLDEPSIDVFEIRLSAEGKLASIAFSNLGHIDNIRYGSSEEVALVEQKWPDFPVVEGKEMRAPEMFRLLGAASQLFYPTKDAPAETATEPTPKPIRR